MPRANISDIEAQQLRIRKLKEDREKAAKLKELEIKQKEAVARARNEPWKLKDLEEERE